MFKQYQDIIAQITKHFFHQKWSAELAIVAQNYANKCTTEHNPYRNQQASFQEVGENLYWNTGM